MLHFIFYIHLLCLCVYTCRFSVCYLFFFIFFLFFFLMIRRPPRSTLFPTRRSSDLLSCSCADCELAILRLLLAQDEQARSEEHTSELQSLRHLVCRLLLEKKKKKACNSDAIITKR